MSAYLPAHDVKKIPRTNHLPHPENRGYMSDIYNVRDFTYSLSPTENASSRHDLYTGC